MWKCGYCGKEMADHFESCRRCERARDETAETEGFEIIRPAGDAFASLDGPARWAKAFLLATLGLTVVAIISGLMQVDLLARAASGGIVEADAEANDARQQLIGGLQIVMYLATAITFLAWFHRAHKNLPALGGRDLKYTPRWAVGGFILPLINLVRPLQVMREVWHASDPAGLERDTAPSGPSVRNQLATPPQVGWWWALLLVAWLLGSIIGRLGRGETGTLEELQTFSVLLVFSDVLDVPSALVTMGLVGRITGWQEQRAEQIKRGAVVIETA